MFVVFAHSSLFSIISSWFFLLILPEFFQTRNLAQQTIMTATLTTVRHVWYCHHPGSKLRTWDSSLFPGKVSGPLVCSPALSSQALILITVSWVMMWMELLVFTNSGSNLSCSTNLGELWRDLVFGYWNLFPGDGCVSVRGRVEKIQESFGPVLLRVRNKGIHLRSSLSSFSAFAVKHFGQFSPRTVSNWNDVFWV